MWSDTTLQHHKEELVHVTKMNFVFQRNICKKINEKKEVIFLYFSSVPSPKQM